MQPSRRVRYPTVAPGGVFNIENSYEHLAIAPAAAVPIAAGPPAGPNPPYSDNDADITFWVNNQERHLQNPSPLPRNSRPAHEVRGASNFVDFADDVFDEDEDQALGAEQEAFISRIERQIAVAGQHLALSRQRIAAVDQRAAEPGNPTSGRQRETGEVIDIIEQALLDYLNRGSQNEVVEDQTPNEDDVHAGVQVAGAGGQASEDDDDDDDDDSQFELEFEPALLQSDAEDAELDPEEGGPVLPVDIRKVQEKIAHIRDLVTSNSEFVAYHGYHLPPNYKVADVERLLAQAGCYPPDTYLTAEELQSEPVTAWLREFAIYMPDQPYIPPTGEVPSLLGTKTVRIPTRMGYSAANFTAFVENHIRILMPSHPQYPQPGKDMCEICHGPYSEAHPPVAITDAGACRMHIFGYQCLRKHLSSNTSVAHKCPKCRTRWFRPRRHEMRDVLRAWAKVDRKEQAALRKEEEAFGTPRPPPPTPPTLGDRACDVLFEGSLVAWEAAGLAAVKGKKWVFKVLGFDQDRLDVVERVAQ